MLKNVKIATQITYSLCAILVLVAGLGLFTWDRLNRLERIRQADEHAHVIGSIAQDIAYAISEFGHVLARFIDAPDTESEAGTLAAIQHARDLAQKLNKEGSGKEELATADRLIGLTGRQLEEAREFGRVYLEQAVQMDRFRELELAYHDRMQRLEEKLEARGGIEKAYLALRAADSALETSFLVDHYLDDTTGAAFDAAQASYARTGKFLNEMEGTELTPEERLLLGEALHELKEFWQSAQAIKEGMAVSREARNRVETGLADMLAQANAIAHGADEVRMGLDARYKEISRSMMSSVVMGIAATVILGAAIAILTMMSLSRRFARTVAQARSLADNDMDVEITDADGENELAQIARTLVVFKENTLERQRLAEDARAMEATALAKREAEMQNQARVVREIGAGLHRLAHGDLTETIPSPEHDPFPAEYDELREAYNSVVDSLSGTLSRISVVADMVRVGSAEITSAAEDLSSRAETQAATLEESATALNELSESVKATASRARNAEKASHDNRSIAESGASVVRDAVVAMKGIEKSSDQITRIIGVIDDIAFQTNLLALNAGVEAARAGDAGRGFAVVASEVRGLAQRASDSAREIKTLISESATQVETGSGLVDRTGECLEQILRKAQDVSEQISAIAVAASEQSTGLGEITLGVNQLDQVTQQNAAVAEATNAVATSLQQRADDLMREFSGFRTGEADAAGPSAGPDPQDETVAQAEPLPAGRAGRERNPGAAQFHEF